ncbi:MAG: energy-coupling factor ABC transporter ATP-binding protein [Deltaproteobacteria bacterium]|nr:energy-coupling factor ABC transporter ATP-binding protein [Deltaproteobacteria bacterium]
MIYIKNVSFYYHKDKWIISNLSLKIATGTWNIIAGPEGSGKSTLAKLIKGMLKPQNGEVVFKSENVVGSDKVGYISGSDLGSVVGVTVLDDICFEMENLRVARSEMQARAKDALDWTELQGFEGRLTHTLSGGELQKLCLASVLASGAKILILDEAFSMLDVAAKRHIRTLISSLKEKLGLTIIEITNQARDIAFADMVIFLISGEEVHIFNSPDHFFSSGYAMRWTIPQGGAQSLLISIPDNDRSSIKMLLNSLNITFG